ncbi:MAG TPA: F0F1 ATP synthase subunit A [Polyangiaceae bacterium]|nr:F0F1 ATP synthase subunit A [Polyangiaceae bacterium]
MPGHDTWLTLILEHIKETLDHNAALLGETFVGHHPATWHVFEPILASALVMLVLVALATRVRSQLTDTASAVIPDTSLTLRTFMEAFIGYFHDMAKNMMGPVRAKKYFPLIGASALFVFFSNILALLPGFPVPTSHLSVTAGCALVVFVLFNVYGLMANGSAYIKHLFGPAWYLAPLLFVIEVISLCVRPVTLAVRLMLNMAVDHLIMGILLSMFPLFLPLPVMVLGVLVIAVQTLVFTMLTCIYIGLATEHLEH